MNYDAVCNYEEMEFYKRFLPYFSGTPQKAVMKMRHYYGISCIKQLFWN